MQVLANGTNGYNDTIEIALYGWARYIGDVVVHLDTWRYEINACGHQGDMEQSSRQDMESDQTWTFKISRDANRDHMIRAHCNQQFAWEFTVSENNCMNWGWTGSWNEDIHKVWFPSTDTASDFHRHRPHDDSGSGSKPLSYNFTPKF